MDCKCVLNYSLDFMQILRGWVAMAICDKQIDVSVDIFLDSLSFYETQVQRELLRDIKSVQEWGRDVGYELSFQYNEKPLISELASTDGILPIFLLKNPTLQIIIKPIKKETNGILTTDISCLDFTFPTRLKNFISEVHTADQMSEEEKDFLLYEANKLVEYQKINATEKIEIDYLERITKKQ